MISDDHLKILMSVLDESCPEGKIVPRSTLFSKFESQAKSKMEIYAFKKALSFLIKNGIINGYGVKIGRNGGVFRIVPMERVSITCSSGKFIGEISRKELSRIVTDLKQTKKESNGNYTTNRS